MPPASMCHAGVTTTSNAQSPVPLSTPLAPAPTTAAASMPAMPPPASPRAPTRVLPRAPAAGPVPPAADPELSTAAGAASHQPAVHVQPLVTAPLAPLAAAPSLAPARSGSAARNTLRKAALVRAGAEELSADINAQHQAILRCAYRRGQPAVCTCSHRSCPAACKVRAPTAHHHRRPASRPRLHLRASAPEHLPWLCRAVSVAMAAQRGEMGPITPTAMTKARAAAT
jgi:hypothetical protein